MNISLNDVVLLIHNVENLLFSRKNNVLYFEIRKKYVIFAPK